MEPGHAVDNRQFCQVKAISMAISGEENSLVFQVMSKANFLS